VTLLATKLLLAPLFIVGASLVSRRFGVRVAGVLVGLPVIAGPILLVLALAHGRSFAAAAATGTLLGMVALIAFVLVYVAASRRLAWPFALLLGWTAFLAVVAALRPVNVGAVAALCFACAACGLTLVVLPRPGPRRAAASGEYPRWDLPLRAACAVVPILAVTGAAGALGPHLAGLLAAFPIITPVLAAFTHAQQGSRESDRLLHAMTVGFFAYALFCFTVAVAIRGLGIAATFALAAALALLVQGAAVALTRRGDRRVPAEAPA
jgi:hypothetical protein